MRGNVSKDLRHGLSFVAAIVVFSGGLYFYYAFRDKTPDLSEIQNAGLCLYAVLAGVGAGAIVNYWLALRVGEATNADE